MAHTDQVSLGLYISIPFCRSKCTYCNFASGVYPAAEHERYVERLVADAHAAREWASAQGVELPRAVDTVYLGGGTPSLLDAALVTRLFNALRERFEIDGQAEITVECAPGQLSEETLEAFQRAGANRFSLGVQSFVDAEARATGRLHTCAIALQEIARLRAAGIANLSIDLIAGLGGQTRASWEESLDALLASGAPHASVYMLEVDEDSRLGRELLTGGARYSAALVPSDETIVAMYERARERLEAAGLRQYEISNFAREGFESKHNLRYWLRRPYLGLGLDASSMLRATDGRVLRTTTTDDLKRYLATATMEESTWVGSAAQLEEAWFLGLRRNVGVRIADIEAEFGADPVAPTLETAASLCEQGLLHFDGATASLTDAGRLLSNEVFARFLADNE